LTRENEEYARLLALVEGDLGRLESRRAEVREMPRRIFVNCLALKNQLSKSRVLND
jgi:hypothetical protein